MSDIENKPNAVTGQVLSGKIEVKLEGKDDILVMRNLYLYQRDGGDISIDSSMDIGESAKKFSFSFPPDIQSGIHAFTGSYFETLKLDNSDQTTLIEYQTETGTGSWQIEVIRNLVNKEINIKVIAFEAKMKLYQGDEVRTLSGKGEFGWRVVTVNMGPAAL